MSDRQGLPLKPGQRVDQGMADGLVGKDEIASAEGVQMSPEEFLEKNKQENAEKASSSRVSADKAEKEVEPPKKPCPRCGYDTKVPWKVEITDQDKQEFTRMVLTGCPFTKTYEVMGGKMKIFFHDVSMEEEDNVTAHVRKQSGRIDMDVRMLYVIGMRMNLVYALSRLEIDDPDDPAGKKIVDYDGIRRNILSTPGVQEQIQKNPEDRCKILHDQMFNKEGAKVGYYSLIYQEFCKFDTLYRVLVSRAQDPNF